MNRDEIEIFIVGLHTHLVEAMQKIDRNANGIVFVVDEKKCLCGALSDGDIRRWLLKAGGMDAEVWRLMKKDPHYIEVGEKPKAHKIMKEKSIRALPVVDEEKKILDLCLNSDFETVKKRYYGGLETVPVVIMAGGKGTRLYPYTKILPKPLLPIGEVPIVERVMESFAEYGVKDFYMTVNYKKNMIKSYFSETEKSYEITYVEEDEPLGTGGSLKLIARKFEAPLFVANCDSMIRTDYAELYQYHKESGNAITVVTSMKNDTIPYGVVYSRESGKIDRIEEKPTRSYLINTGMYVINPDMIELIPKNAMFHMTHLVEKAQAEGYQIGMYPVSEDSFLDMGEFAEMKRMEEKLRIE